MRTQGLRTGHLVALAGAIAALASLWRPWYRIELPQSFRDMLNGQAARTPGAFGDLARGLAGMLPSRLEASGWQELQGADVVLCVGAVAVAALVVAAAGGFGPAVRVDSTAAGRAIAALGAVGVAITAQHAIAPPGGSAAADMVKLAGGLWLAFGGCAATLAGGLLAARPARPVRGAPPLPVHRYENLSTPLFDSARSVPPPPGA
jgi:hypothetical protein